MVGTTNESARVAWVEKKILAIPKGYRILDAGAGEQRFKPICGHLEYVSLDFAKYDGLGDQSALQMGSWDNSRLDIICDIVDIPVLDASFDVVLCTEVLEHLPDPVRAIMEFSRLLKPGGELILTAPFCSMTHFAPYHYVSGFNRFYYEKHLPSYGFIIEEITPNGNYFEYIAQEIHRLPSISERYAKEQLSWVEKLAKLCLLNLLERLNAKGFVSSELLCYGYHIIARKQQA